MTSLRTEGGGRTAGGWRGGGWGLAVGVLGAFLLLGSGPARANPSAKLVFARGRGTEACPSEADFRAAVAARVGYDPFFPWARRTVTTRIDASGDGFRARMEVLDEDGTLLGEKTFVSRDDDCAEVVRTLALAVSLAIDIADARPAATEAEPPRQVPSEPASEPLLPIAHDTPVAPAPGPSRGIANVAPRWQSEGSFTARASAGLSPSPSLGVALGFAVRRSAWSLGLEGRYDAGASGSVEPRGEVAFSHLAGSIVPCFSRGIGLACAFVTLGQVRAETSGIAQPGSDVALFFASGARLGVEVPLSPAVGLRAMVEGGVAPLRHDARIGGQDVQRTALFFASLGVGAVVRF